MQLGVAPHGHHSLEVPNVEGATWLSHPAAEITLGMPRSSKILLVSGAFALVAGVLVAERTVTSAEQITSPLPLDTAQISPPGDRAVEQVVASAGVDATQLESGSLLGRVEIPKLDLDVPLLEGVEHDQLARGLGHYPSTDWVMERGVVAIAGHRTGYGSPLLHADQLVPGDRILIVAGSDRSVYRVTGSTIVDPDDTWVLDGDPDSDAEYQLVVTTCTPAYTAERRLVIWAAKTPQRAPSS